MIGLLVQEKVIVAKVRPGHVPMKVLGLEIERERVGKKKVQRAGDVAHGVRRKVCWSCERSGSPGLSVLLVHVVLGEKGRRQDTPDTYPQGFSLG